MPNREDPAPETRERSPLRTAEARHFPWEELPSFESPQVDRANRLLALLADRRGATSALRALADELESLTGLEHALEIRGVRIHPEGTGAPVFGDALRIPFHLPPNPEPGLVAVDMELVDAWLGSLLDSPPEARPVGAVGDPEFGLVTFVLLSVLKQLRQWGAPPVVLPTERPLDGEIDDELRRGGALVELAIEVRAIGAGHLARILVSDGLIRNMELFTEGAARRRRAAERLDSGPLADLELSYPVSIGRTRLRREVARALDRGDVVFFDEEGWRRAEDRADDEPASEPGARLHLRPSSEHPSLPGYLRAEAGAWIFEVDQPRLRPRDQPMNEREPDPAESSSPSDSTDEEPPRSTELLESPEVELEVRIGRADLTLRELGRLGAGQIVELDRSVGDPADLVVEGETIGTGELVEIEGRLGIRIDQIDN